VTSLLSTPLEGFGRELSHSPAINCRCGCTRVVGGAG
ncbi:uncharacterized protein METZ01_LOCUS313559, partial [marine metagenome]